MTEAPATSPKTNICPGCGAHFTCGMNAGHARCWCADLPPTQPVPALPAGSTTGCFCPACLASRLRGASAGPAPG